MSSLVLFLAMIGALQQPEVPFQAESGQFPVGAVFSDPIARLQSRLERGDAQLKYDSKSGYLASVLSQLRIPVSSQSLVFSRTSLQTEFISPSTPRALYFNDDVYVGFDQDAPMLEIASVDPKYGTLFYVLDQSENTAPKFQRLTFPCISCHGPARDEVPSPLLLVMSAAADAMGEPIGNLQLVTDRTPLNERWGGWYVSARSNLEHLGNRVLANGVVRSLREPAGPSPTLNPARYLTANSDVVALMLLSHQADVHNRINEAALQTRALRPGAAATAVSEAVEPLVEALLFAKAVPLSGRVRGSSTFAEEFSKNGIRDRRGRSLKDLDLERRLLKYPLSYLIYSESFDGMPAMAREYVYGRLWEVFTGKDTSENFRHLSNTDRSTLLEILSETKPEFKAWVDTRR